MTGRKVALSKRMTVSEFERRVPRGAKLNRMRIAEGKVSFALGYNNDESMAVMWSSQGKAFVRPMTKKAQEVVDFRPGTATRFNGYVYYRCRDLDLVKQ